MIYKGNHYHITVMTDEGHHIWVDTHDVWDKGDLVGINFPAKHIKITPLK
jgi:spermidine/putrescine transport system ATP-binding protein